MIAAFKARNIKVYLFTHPLDGRDYSADQQALLGFNDPSGNYQKWNDFINDVHAEIVERYGNDIVGIGMDSEFSMSGDSRWAGKLDLPRLRATILSRRAGLSLSALACPNDTCELGIKEVWRPSWGRIRLVDGQCNALAAPTAWSVPIDGWTSQTFPASQPAWVQVDLGVNPPVISATTLAGRDFIITFE